MSQPLPLTAVQIVNSLPPLGRGSSIPVSKFLVGRTKCLMEHPLESLIRWRERDTGPMRARVHIQRGQELEVFRLLTERGVTTWLPAGEVFSDEGGVCLNGMLGVFKPNNPGHRILILINILRCILILIFFQYFFFDLLTIIFKIFPTSKINKKSYHHTRQNQY